MTASDGNERDLTKGSEADGDDAQKRWARELEEARPFGEVLGQRLQEVREEQKRTAEDVAQDARHYGLSWHRPTVRQIEQGKRALSAAELMMLPLVYRVRLADVIREEETVWLTPKVRVYGRELRRVLGGDYIPHPRALRAPGGWHLKGWSDLDGDEVVRSVAQWSAARAERDPWPTGATGSHVVQGKPDEAETKAAKRLGTTPHYVAYAARETWGHGLAAEREARLRERGELPEEKRALQSARGHITRALLAELEPVVKAHEERRGQPDRPDPADMGPLKVTRNGRETDG
ncbi:hypothetical protein GCM10010252_08980 [Streptomyces aureoverticillatus]|uniref:helix-turn-helix domain-containing protein n=1 Tax=Streptomyces alboflavus TaxID=67267 RepID=UPI000F6563A1|nr:helix-turn-helix transcriptional regulator [Streptomyces alboflavus]GGR72725.1 hypothetical protein GCM10010252_08980 [Streptomyces aureoverticillatus]